MDVISTGYYMSKKKFFFLGFIIFLIIIVIAISTHWRVKEYYFRYLYDLEHPPKTINSKAEIDAILRSFKTIKYQDLDKEYIKYTKSREAKYETLLNQKTYFVIGRNDFFKYLAGNFRIVDFIAKDKYYRKSLSNASANYLWLMDKNLLYKILELMHELEKEGYNKKAFGITNGHRHPRYNERIGGAKLSRHIMGEAIDIRIYDIDLNGKYEKKDKDIVLNILEHKVIKEDGGIGRYPNTRAIHFDVRGYRARWDSY